MDPTIDRSRAARQATCIDAGAKTSSELEPATVKAMLSEMSGTPLAASSAWDDEAKARLKAFQRSEGLPATGMPDDVSVERLQRRFEETSGVRHTDAVHSPGAEAHGHVVEVVKQTAEAVHRAIETIEKPANESVKHGIEAWAKDVLAKFDAGEVTEAEVRLAADKLQKSMTVGAHGSPSAVRTCIEGMLARDGKTMGQALDAVATERFAGKTFAQLTETQKGEAIGALAKKAGVAEESASAGSHAMPKIGKALFAVAIALSVYEIATAEDKGLATAKVAGGLVGGYVGQKVGESVGGALCGPGCAIAGGVLFGLMGSLAGESAAEHAYHAIRG